MKTVDVAEFAKAVSDTSYVVLDVRTPVSISGTYFSIDVNAPVFADFPMTMECRIKEKMDESEEGYYILAEVVNILVDEKYLDAAGNPDVAKMNLITYEPVSHSYFALGEKVGNAFSDGKKLK